MFHNSQIVSKKKKGRYTSEWSPFFSKKGKKPMITTQIERLKADSRNLDNYAKKLKKQGRTDLMHKIIKKKDFLDKQIENIIEAYGGT